MKLGFVTCVQLGLSCIEAIYEAGAKLDLLISLRDDQAPRKSGRIYLDEFAERHDVELLKVSHINDDEAIERIRELDWLFIIGWSQIAGPDVLDAPARGVLGMHPTLLPEGRGRAAIPWAILKGLDKTGVTLFKLDEGVDTGPIVAQQEIALSPGTTATDLYEKVSVTHAELLRQVIPKMLADEISFLVQDESGATIWPGRKPEDGEFDLTGSVHDAERLVRAVTHPYPGAYFVDDAGKKVIVWTARVVDTASNERTLEFSDGILALDDWEYA